MLFLLPTVVQLLVRVEAFEAAAATALAIPAPAASSPATGKVDVEKGVEGEGGAAIRDPPQQQQPSLAHTLQSSPCASNAVTLLVMMSSLASWMTIAKGIAAGCRGVPAALSSKAALVTGVLWLQRAGRCWTSSLRACWSAQGVVQVPHIHWATLTPLTPTSSPSPPFPLPALRNPTAQFAFKFWLSNSLAMMGCILFLWKVGSTGAVHHGLQHGMWQGASPRIRVPCDADVAGVARCTDPLLCAPPMRAGPTQGGFGRAGPLPGRLAGAAGRGRLATKGAAGILATWPCGSSTGRQPAAV